MTVDTAKCKENWNSPRYRQRELRIDYKILKDMSRNSHSNERPITGWTLEEKESTSRSTIGSYQRLVIQDSVYLSYDFFILLTESCCYKLWTEKWIDIPKPLWIENEFGSGFEVYSIFILVHHRYGFHVFSLVWWNRHDVTIIGWSLLSCYCLMLQPVNDRELGTSKRK